MSEPFKPCAVVPTFENPRTVRGVVEAIRPHLHDVFLVDDGSAPAGRAACESISADGLATLLRHAANRGKGAAVMAGFAAAYAAGFTHALQVDADGQHDTARIPSFLHTGQQRPDALVLGHPVYDGTAPRVRLIARRFTKFWVDLELGQRGPIVDALIGFRLYPLAASLAAGVRGNGMEFDVEIAVRMARAGTPIINLPVGVRYLRADEGGISHFRPLRDNLRFCRLHSRLCISGMFGWAWRAVRGGRS